MIEPFLRGLRQIGDPDFRKVLLNAVGLTLAAYVFTAIAVWQGLQFLPQFEQDWLNTLVGILSGLGLVVAMALVFPGLTMLFVGIFLDDVALAVERRHYPADPPGQAMEFWPGLIQSARFAGIVLGLNLLVLPFYLVLLLAMPPLAFVAYFSLNGYLFGREYFELVAFRHRSRPEAQELRRRHATRLFLTGCMISFLFTIPVLNLLVPLIAVAAMVHIYKSLPRRS
ncbi:MAG: EI24 domain-containing protein [Alphaproteobacteria bacterium]|nr:EI24 domain-containing protein [Alphaproteobacteria bacterium]